MQVIGKICTCHFSPEEAPFKKACIDLAIAGAGEALSQRVRTIKRGDGCHHINDGLCTETGYSGTPIVLKFIRYVTEERSQPLAFMQEMIWP